MLPYLCVRSDARCLTTWMLYSRRHKFGADILFHMYVVYHIPVHAVGAAVSGGEQSQRKLCR